MSEEQLDKLEKQKAYLELKIKELITYSDVMSFDPDADPYVDIAVSTLQLALNQVEKRKSWLLGGDDAGRKTP